MPVKIDPLIVEELASMDLVLWSATHPKRLVLNEKTDKMTLREDKGWCIVSLAGPGVEKECQGSGPTLRQAVDGVLSHYFADRVPGAKGAMLRLEKALWDTFMVLMESRVNAEFESGEFDDDIPF